MDFVQYIRKTDLARNTHQIIRQVQRGQTAVIQSHGQSEVAIIDIIDYHILRAVMRYYAQQPAIDLDAGLPDAVFQAISDPQEQYNVAIAHYLAGAISLSRTAELLNLPWLDLRTRFLRLDVPLRATPADSSEAIADIETAQQWMAS